MKGRIIPYILLLALVLSQVSCARVLSGSRSTAASGDTLFIRSSQWPSVEKDELVLVHKGKPSVIYTLETADGSSLGLHFSCTSYDCFAAYNNAADGNSFLFFDRSNRRLYITYGCYAQFDPIPESADFSNRTVLLRNRLAEQHTSDTLNIGRQTNYVGLGNGAPIIRVEIKDICKEYD